MEITDLTLRLGDRLILDSFSAEIPDGRITALIGPNGAGKTSLIRCLSGELEAIEGTVTVAGRPVVLSSDEWKATSGTVPDSDMLFDELSVREHLELAGTLFGVGGAELAKRVESLLSFSALGSMAERLGSELSAGMRKRLAVSLSLIHGPRYFLLDEPLNTLDYASSDNFMSLLRFLRSRGCTLLISGHSVPLLLELADRVLLIDHGRLVEVIDGTARAEEAVFRRLSGRAGSFSERELDKQLDWIGW